jgi:hypothetical protein
MGRHSRVAHRFPMSCTMEVASGKVAWCVSRADFRMDTPSGIDAIGTRSEDPAIRNDPSDPHTRRVSY